jgi:hypothetical protein
MPLLTLLKRVSSGGKQVILESLTFWERTAKNYMGAGNHCVSANIDHCKGHVAQRRRKVILQGYHAASAPRCARPSHRFRCV